MKNSEFYQKIKRHIDAEVETAVELIETGNLQLAFYHLERAHVLGQSITMEHTRVHWLIVATRTQKSTDPHTANI